MRKLILEAEEAFLKWKDLIGVSLKVPFSSLALFSISWPGQHRMSFEVFTRAYQLALYRSVEVGEGRNTRRVIAPGMAWFRRSLPDILGANLIMPSFPASNSNVVITHNSKSDEILMITVSRIGAGDELRLDSEISDVKSHLFYIADYRIEESPKKKTGDTRIQRNTFRRIVISKPGEPLKFAQPGAFHRPDRIGVALLVSSKVNAEFGSTGFNIHLINTLLRSMWATLPDPSQYQGYHLGLYLGFDNGDRYYDNEENIATLHAHIMEILPAGFPLEMYYVCTGDTHHAPARSWSILGNLAYWDG